MAVKKARRQAASWTERSDSTAAAGAVRGLLADSNLVGGRGLGGVVSLEREGERAKRQLGDGVWMELMNVRLRSFQDNVTLAGEGEAAGTGQRARGSSTEHRANPELALPTSPFAGAGPPTPRGPMRPGTPVCTHARELSPSGQSLVLWSRTRDREMADCRGRVVGGSVSGLACDRLAKARRNPLNACGRAWKKQK